MPLDRESIERHDLPRTRRGDYEAEAVDLHLRTVADEVQLLRRAAEAPAVDPLAAAASHQVRAIVAAAEQSAEELRGEAAEKAREHVERVALRGQALLARIAAVQRELDAVMEGVREGAGRLAGEVAELDRVAASPAGIGPDPQRATDTGDARVADHGPDADGPEETEPRSDAPDEPLRSHAPVAEGEPGPDEAAAEEPKDAGARLVALEMALEGSPREDTARFLSEHYALAAPGPLLDEIYSRAGR